MMARYFFASLIIGAMASIFIFPELLLKTPRSIRANSASTLGDFQSKDPLPSKKQNFQDAPIISAKSAIVIDAKTGLSFFEKDPHIRHLPASTTKLATALTALENCPPEKVVAIAHLEKEPSSMGLEIGDLVTVETLIFGLLISSGNDAAFALAGSCATSSEEFVSQMNSLAKRLKMENTHFANPAGFDDENQYTTASDLAKLSKYAVANPLISKIVVIKSIVLTDVTGIKTYYLKNINELLGKVEGLEGVKTGQTEGAQEVLVSQTSRNGHTIIVAILVSEDRFEDSRKLIEWAFRNFEWRF